MDRAFGKSERLKKLWHDRGSEKDFHPALPLYYILVSYPKMYQNLF